MPTPDAYVVAVTPTLKLPDGVKPALDVSDPTWTAAKGWAHRHGLSQQAFSEAVDLVAARDTVSVQQLDRARNAEMRKLGAGATARLAAIETAFATKFATHRGASTTHRGPDISEDEWGRLTPGERYNFAKARSTAPR